MNSQTQPRTYYVVRKHVHNGKIQTLDQSDFTSEKEAKNWFTAALGTMLEEDTTGHFRQELWERLTGGWLNHCLANPTAADLQDVPPAWYSGPGVYDESNNLVLGYDDPPLDRLTIHDWTAFAIQLGFKGLQTHESGKAWDMNDYLINRKAT